MRHRLCREATVPTTMQEVVGSNAWSVCPESARGECGCRDTRERSSVDPFGLHTGRRRVPRSRRSDRIVACSVATDA